MELTTQSQAIISTALHWAIGSLLGIAVIDFLLRFLRPSLRVGIQLRDAHRALAELKKAGPILDLDELRNKVMLSDGLRHCWDEFRETLHAQKQPNSMGELEVSRWRATATAGSFFTEQSLIETPLRTEYFKHLPGILTGLGIIGTFSGLILGLQGFKVSDNAEIARTSLGQLIGTVGEAFILSGSAILLAMAVTAIEKLSVNSRFAQLDKFCGVIDSLFDAGVGEEYLQRLVEAAETSATQAVQMKESLVTDLKQALTELTNRQIDAIQTSGADMGRQVSTGVADVMKQPMEEMTKAIATLGTTQGDAVNKLLTDVLAQFAAQMEGMFGSQMKGMNELLAQTANTIQTASSRFDRVAEQLQQAGSDAAEAMAKRLDEALQQMQTRQGEANDQMGKFITHLKENIAKGQSESAELSMQMMQELSDTTSELVKKLQVQTYDAERKQADTHKQFVDHTTAVLNQQGTQVTSLTQSVQEAIAAMKDVSQRLENATNSNIEQMSVGAERLQGAASRLTDNLDKVKAASDGMGLTAEKINASAGTLNIALNATQQTLNDQKAVRDTLALMVSNLKETIQIAETKANLTKDLVSSLEKSSTELNKAQLDAAAYLSGVSKVLEEVHTEFARQMENTMRKGTADFQEELASAVNALRTGIEDLGNVLDSLPTSS